MHQLEWIGIIRHGESTGNVAASTAEEKGSDLIDIAERDADVPLSDTGQKQAEAVAGWLDDLPEDERPQVVDRVAVPAGAADRRDRAQGVRHPHAARRATARPRARRARPAHGARHPVRSSPRSPSDGSGSASSTTGRPAASHGPTCSCAYAASCATSREDHPEQRVLFFAHDAVVSLFRYVLEGLDEEELMTERQGVTDRQLLDQQLAVG